MSPRLRTEDWTPSVREENSPERDRFLRSHVDLVRYIALRISSRLPASVETDDLVNDGVIGLLDAVQKFDPVRGVRFRTYAERRVRGAILDGLRQRDWQSRSVRRGQRELEQTTIRLRTTQGRAASEEELAREMKLGLTQYRQLLQDASAGQLLPLEDLPDQAQPTLSRGQAEPHAVLERKQLLEALAEELAHLPERERRVLELYYHSGLNMKEVGAVLGVTESRVCQLHGQAAARLRASLNDRLRSRAQAPQDAMAFAGDNA